MPEIATPKLPSCEEWTLTEKLDHEKDVTGMFMSGHPLDHFKFELRYYSIMQLSEFNEVKESTTLISANANRNFRIAGLVIDAQHRVTKTGRNFGALTIEDFSGKTELMLWSDDYVRFQNYLEKGKNLLINGFFKQRYNSDQFEFKVTSISLLEMAKQTLTRQLEINIEPASVTKEFVTFIEKNICENPGKSSLRFNIYEPAENLKVTMYTLEKGFTMNDEMAGYLLDNPDVEINVGLVG
jgi:DNA polymerase-3 subunit alpha